MTTTTTKSAEAPAMPIADRLEHCAKFTGLDAVRELLIEAAAAVRKRDAVVKLMEGELQARAQVQGELSVDQMREMLSVHKLAIVPMRATHAMLDAMSDDDWQWSDLLAAAEAITEDEHDWIDATPEPAQATQEGA